jgi:hypothetical protein
VETIVTGKSPASPRSPGLHPDALEGRTIHPYSDFLLHNVGTGDGIAIALVELYGRERMEKRFREESTAAAEAPKTSEKTEDECSESFQTGVAEGEKHPNPVQVEAHRRQLRAGDTNELFRNCSGKWHVWRCGHYDDGYALLMQLTGGGCDP